MEKNANRADPWTMLLDAVLVPVCFAAGVTGGGWALKALGCQDDAATFLVELVLALVCFLLFYEGVAALLVYRRKTANGARNPRLTDADLCGTISLALKVSGTVRTQ